MLSYIGSYLWTAEENAENNPLNDCSNKQQPQNVPNSSGRQNDASWVLINRDGADSPEPEVVVEGEHALASLDKPEGSLMCASHQPESNHWYMTPPPCLSASTSLAGVDAETVLEASYVENCLLELSVSHTNDVRDYLENSQADIRTLVSSRKKPKRYQVKPKSLQSALQIQLEPKFEAAKLDQKAKLRSKEHKKSNAPKALKRHNMQRNAELAKKSAKCFMGARNKVINQCASRPSCH